MSQLIAKAELATRWMRSAAYELDHLAELLPRHAKTEGRSLQFSSERIRNAANLLTLEALTNNPYTSSLVAKVGKGVLRTGRTAAAVAVAATPGVLQGDAADIYNNYIDHKNSATKALLEVEEMPVTPRNEERVRDLCVRLSELLNKMHIDQITADSYPTLHGKITAISSIIRQARNMTVANQQYLLELTAFEAEVDAILHDVVEHDPRP